MQYEAIDTTFSSHVHTHTNTRTHMHTHTHKFWKQIVNYCNYIANFTTCIYFSTAVSYKQKFISLSTIEGA
jgi:hypothetical protein